MQFYPPHFNFSGPDTWANESPDCAGNRQSPINIPTRKAQPFAFVPLVMPAVYIQNTTITNTGHNGKY